MTTNQEGVHLAVRDITGTARSYNEDWHALFDSESIAAGTFNERMLGWINATLSTSYTNLNEAMQAFAVEQGFANWASMNTFVAGSEASTFLRTYGPHGMVMNFADDASIAIDDATDVLDFRSSGQVSNGALAGPGAKLTYAAPSAKLTEQADGNLGFQAHNLCLWSNDFSNVVWNKVSVTVSAASSPPEVGASAFRLEASGSGARVLQSVSLFGDGVFGIWARRVSGSGAVSIGWDISTPTILALTSSWQFFQIAANLASATYTPRVTFADSGDIIEVCAPRIRRTPSVDTYIAATTAAAYDLPYVYSGGVRTGIMVEPAATNPVRHNRDLTNAVWTKRGATTVAKTATGVDGIVNSATAVTNLGAAGVNDFFDSLFSAGGLYPANSPIAASFYIKKVSGSGVLSVTNAANSLGWSVDLSLVGSGWQRITPNHPAVTIGTPFVASVGGQFGLSFSAVSGGPLAFDLDCVQGEAGSSVTSPIITYGATVARAADTPEIATSLFPYNVSEGTLYIRAIVPPGVAAGRMLSLTDNTSLLRVADIFAVSSTTLAYFKTSDGQQQIFTSSATSGVRRVSLRYRLNDYIAAHNGILGDADTSTGAMQTATMLEIGHLANAAQMPMIVQQVACFPDGKANAVLQSLGA